MRFGEEYFQPLSENEGGNPDRLREKWFDKLVENSRVYYRPRPALARSIKFRWLDVRRPPRGITADIVFCQNVLIHMEPPLARQCLRNALTFLRTPGLLVCAGMPLDLKPDIAAAGLAPITDSIDAIHDTWGSQRVHYRENPGKVYFELEDLDRTRPDWEVRFSTIFAKK
jgi:hypothetical protein